MWRDIESDRPRLSAFRFVLGDRIGWQEEGQEGQEGQVAAQGAGALEDLALGWLPCRIFELLVWSRRWPEVDMAVEDCRQLTLRNRADLVDRLDSKPRADDAQSGDGPVIPAVAPDGRGAARTHGGGRNHRTLTVVVARSGRVRRRAAARRRLRCACDGRLRGGSGADFRSCRHHRRGVCGMSVNRR